MKTTLVGYSSTGTVDTLIDALLKLDIPGTTLTTRKILTPKRPPIVLPEAPSDGTSGDGTSGDGTSGDGTSGDGTSGDGAKPDGAMVKAAFAAMLGLPEKIEVPGGAIEQGSRLVLCLPVWAASPPPAIMTFLRRQKLRGVEVGAIVVPKEDAGNAARRIEKLVRRKGGTWVGSTVILSAEVKSGAACGAHGAELRALLGGTQ